MHLAVITGNAAIVDILLTSGGNPNIQDRHGNSSLHLAVTYGSETCLQALLRSGSIKPDMDIKNYDGKLKFFLLERTNTQSYLVKVHTFTFFCVVSSRAFTEGWAMYGFWFGWCGFGVGWYEWYNIHTAMANSICTEKLKHAHFHYSNCQSSYS